MGRRPNSSEEEPAGGDEEGGRPRSKRRGRLAKIVFLGGIVAVAVRPQVRNKLLDALFGPEEQFEYESPTEPISHGIESDESEVSWPAGAAAEDEGPSWTFTEHAEWAASASVPYQGEEDESEDGTDLSGSASEAPPVFEEGLETPPEGGAASSYESQPPSYADLPSSDEPEPPTYEPQTPPPYGDTPSSYEPPAPSYGNPPAYDPQPPTYEPDTPPSYGDTPSSYEPPAPSVPPAYDPQPPPYEPQTPAYGDIHSADDPEPPSYGSSYEPPTGAVEDPGPPTRAFGPDAPAEVTELSSYRIETVVSGDYDAEPPADEDAVAAESSPPVTEVEVAASDLGVPASEPAVAPTADDATEAQQTDAAEEPAPAAGTAAEASPAPAPDAEPAPTRRPAIGEATPPPLIAWWRSRRRKAPGPGETPEPPRWE
jgi:hypothetical protein